MKKLIALGVVLCVVTGCSGMEIGGKAWIDSIDEKSESSRTYRQNVPLKCYFTDCKTTDAELPAK
jgi:hypothetical protein